MFRHSILYMLPLLALAGCSLSEEERAVRRTAVVESIVIATFNPATLANGTGLPSSLNDPSVRTSVVDCLGTIVASTNQSSMNRAEIIEQINLDLGTYRGPQNNVM